MDPALGIPMPHCHARSLNPALGVCTGLWTARRTRSHHENLVFAESPQRHLHRDFGALRE